MSNKLISPHNKEYITEFKRIKSILMEMNDYDEKIFNELTENILSSIDVSEIRSKEDLFINTTLETFINGLIKNSLNSGYDKVKKLIIDEYNRGNRLFKLFEDSVNITHLYEIYYYRRNGYVRYNMTELLDTMYVYNNDKNLNNVPDVDNFVYKVLEILRFGNYWQLEFTLKYIDKCLEIIDIESKMHGIEGNVGTSSKKFLVNYLIGSSIYDTLLDRISDTDGYAEDTMNILNIIITNKEYFKNVMMGINNKEDKISRSLKDHALMTSLSLKINYKEIRRNMLNDDLNLAVIKNFEIENYSGRLGYTEINNRYGILDINNVFYGYELQN